ncbi:MAG: hypothetical protein ACP6IP_09925 [Candidatus Njordarchaeia archaeon]
MKLGKIVIATLVLSLLTVQTFATTSNQIQVFAPTTTRSRNMLSGFGSDVKTILRPEDPFVKSEGWYTSHVSNISIGLSLVVKNASKVELENVELSPMISGFPSIQMVVQDYAYAHIKNLSVTETLPLVILNIYVSGYATLIIENSTLRNIKLNVWVGESGTLELKNSTFMVNDLEISTYGEGTVIIDNVDFVSDSINGYIYQYDDSLIELKNINFDLASSRFEMNIGGTSTCYIDNFNASRSMELYINTLEESSLSIYNANLTVSTIGINIRDYSTFTVNNSVFSSGETPGYVIISSFNKVSISYSTLDYLKTYTDPLTLYYSSPPTDVSVVLNRTNVSGIYLLGAQIVLMDHINVNDLYTVLYCFGNLSIIDGMMEENGCSVGPYPFINDTSHTAHLGTYSTIYVISGELIIENSTITEQYILINSSLKIGNNTILNDASITLINSQSKIFDTNGTVEIKTQFSSVEVYNSTLDNLSIYTHNNSLIEIKNNEFSAFNLFASGYASQLLLEDNYLGSETNFLVDTTNDTTFNLTITNLDALPGASGISFELDLSGHSRIVGLNASETIYFSSIRANVIVENSKLNAYYGHFVIDESNITLINSTVIGSTSVYLDNQLSLLNSSYWNGTIRYEISVDGGFVNISEGLPVAGDGFTSSVEIDATSGINSAIPKIYAASQVNVENSFVDSIYFLNSSKFYLHNVTVGSTISIEVPFNADLGNLRLDGKIVDSSIPTLTIVGYGNVTIENSQIHLIEALFTNVTVRNSTINYLVDTYYVSDKKASIINNVVSGFDGHYVSWDANTTIVEKVYGVAAFGSSNVTVKYSNVTAVIAFDTSTVYMENITPLSNITYNTFAIFLMDNSNITLANTEIPSYITRAIIFAADSTRLAVENSTISTYIMLANHATFRSLNSLLGYEYGPSSYNGGIIANDSVSIYLYNTLIPQIIGNNAFHMNIQIFNSRFLPGMGPYSMIINGTEGINIGIYGSPMYALNVSALESASLVLDNTNVTDLGLRNADTNITGTQVSINSISFSSGDLYIENVTIYDASIFFADLTATNCQINLVTLYHTTAHLENFISRENLLAMFSSMKMDNSTVDSFGVDGADVLVTNSSIGFAIPYIMGYMGGAANSFSYPIYSTTYPNNDLMLVNSTVGYYWDEIYFEGVGTATFNNGEIETSEHVYAKNLTEDFSETKLLWKPNRTIVSIYQNSLVYTNISNFLSRENKTIAILVFEKTTSTPPTLYGYYGETSVPSGSTITAEHGTVLERITIYVYGDTLLDTYELVINGETAKRGLLRNQTATFAIDPNLYATDVGGTEITLIVTDVDGGESSYTIIIELTTPRNPDVRCSTARIEYELGMTVGDIEWTITEENPYMYYLYMNDTLVKNGTYENNETISFSPTEHITSAGTYNVTLVATDTAHHSTSSTVIIVVYPPEEPELISMANNTTININETTTLEWVFKDRYPATYTIYVNGTLVKNGTWTSNTPIRFEFTGSKEGTYQIRIVVTDQAGHQNEHTVYVTVIKPSKGGGGGALGGITSPIVIGSLAIVLAAILVLLYLARRR